MEKTLKSNRNNFEFLSDATYQANRKKEFADFADNLRKNPQIGFELLKNAGILNKDGTKSKHYYPDGI